MIKRKKENNEFKLSEDKTTLIKYIGENKKVVIPKGVVHIGKDAFEFCKKIKSITIPNTVVSINEFSFYNCCALEKIKFKNRSQLKCIEKHAFSECNNLKTVKIPRNVENIGDFAFYNCNSLKRIKIPHKVTNIGSYTFYNCYNLEKIIDPNITTIGVNAFEKCAKLFKDGKYKAFKIEENKLKCFDTEYDKNKWNEVKGSLELCKNGIHFVTNLFDVFNYYFGEIDKDIAIYEIEVRGETINEKDSSKCCCRSIRLKRRIFKEELIKMLNKK